MRICFFTDSWLPYCSGVTYAVLNQSTELARRGHQVLIFAAKPWRSICKERVNLPAGVQVVELPFSLPAPNIKDLYLAAPTLLSLRRLAKFKPDVVHLETEWGCGWEGLLASKLLGLPVVGTFHTFFADSGYLKAIGLPDIQLVKRLMWAYEVFFFSRCDMVTSPSAAVKNALISNGLQNPPVVLSNGIQQPESAETIDVAKLRAEYGLDRVGGPIFIHVGRISKEKSLEIVMQAFQRVRRKLPEAHFVLVGDGPTRSHLERLIGSLGITGAVTLLGRVPHDELLDLAIPRLGEVFVTASKTENQPLSIMEAMAFGLPIIGADAKGIPELIAHETSGMLFAPDDVDRLADCMVRLGKDEPLRCRMGAAAKHAIRAHTITGVVDRLEQVYARAIATREKKPAHAPVSQPPAPHIPDEFAPPAPAPNAQWSQAEPDHHEDAVAAAARTDS